MTTEQTTALIRHISEYYPTFAYSGRGMYGKQCVAYTVHNNVEESVTAIFDNENWDDMPRPPYRWNNVGGDFMVYFPSAIVTAAVMNDVGHLLESPNDDETN